MRSRVPLVVAGLALLAGSAALAAQARADARFGLEAGLNESKVTLASGLDLPDPTYRAAWSAGLTLHVPIVRRVSIVTGLRYLECGERLAVSIVTIDGGARFERHLSWRYLAVPVHLRVHPFPIQGLYLAAGPEAGCLLGTWYEDHIRTVPAPALPRLDRAGAHPQSLIFEDLGAFFADPRDAYSRWDLALSGGLGCEFPLAGHTGIVEACYTHGLVDIAKNDALERSTRGIELLLGARW